MCYTHPVPAKTFADFQSAFPQLYRNVVCGFDCPTGWLPLVWQLSEQLASSGMQCDQIKEKFGGLRYYISEYNEKAHSLIDAAEKASLSLCQECGAPAKTGKIGPWLIATLCPEHVAKWKSRLSP